MKAHAIQANRISNREIGCTGKHRFASFGLAQKVASKTAHRKGRKFQAYYCEQCGGAHIGSAIGGNKQRPGAIDPRKPYLVYARNHDGVVCVVGRADSQDGGKLCEIIARDGWEVVKVTRVK